MEAEVVEAWLEAHPDFWQDFFVRKGDADAVDAWLAARGRPPLPRDEPCEDSPPARNNSKRCLRHDFARCKSRSVFHTQEAPSADALASRRSSLKDMRRYASLPPSSATLLSLLIESRVRLPPPRAAPSLPRRRQRLQAAGERAFLLWSVRDVATELDLAALSHRAADNAAALLDADAAALFLVEAASGGAQALVSKGRTPGGAEVRVPWGTGILGHVADTGDCVNLRLATEDPRFDEQADGACGVATASLLCLPVRDASGQVIAVAQAVNKNPHKDGGCFTPHDEKLLETFLQFVGIAITNAQLMAASRQEYERNRRLLEVVHDLFSEQTSLAGVAARVLARATRLLRCAEGALLLLDDPDAPCPHFAHAFHTDPQHSSGSASPGGLLQEAASRVVEAGEVSLSDALLAAPIRDGRNRTIGVAIIMNKLNCQPFDENDEHLFEAFTLFCGLGIHNTLMYSQVEKAMARQKVAIEVLSYHATASNKEVEMLMEQELPGADELNLYSLAFDDFSLDADEMVLAAVAMFLDLGLVKRFAMDKETLYRFLITVRRNYRDVPYHNWRHAFNVAQVMFAILMGCEMKGTFSDVEVLGMFVGCLCHDLDHRGTNNAFQQKAGSALVMLYGTTNTMEHHHFNQAVMILSSENHNIFSGLSAQSYSEVMQVLKQSILATDLSVYFQFRATNAATKCW